MLDCVLFDVCAVPRPELRRLGILWKSFLNNTFSKSVFPGAKRSVSTAETERYVFLCLGSKHDTYCVVT